jgi:hypothetical protein
MNIRRRDLLRIGALTGISAGAGIFRPARASAPDDLSQYFQFPVTSVKNKPVLEDAPARIVESGRIRTGLFKSPVRTMNLLDSSLLAGRSTNLMGFPRLLEWVGAGMAHPEWYFGFIIVDAKILSLSTLYGFSRKTNAYFSHDAYGPAKMVRVAESTWDNITYAKKPGFYMEVLHHLATGFHKVKIDIKSSGKHPQVSAELTWHEDLKKTQPMVMMSPLKGKHFIYNHKAQMPIEGTMTVGGQKIEFNPNRDLANMDEVKSCTGLKNSYTWFNFGGFDQKGRTVGLNASNNSQRLESLWTENCIWAGDQLSMLGPVSFKLGLHDIMKPWTANDQNNMVDIAFYPEGGKTINIGPLGKYYQKCGRFRGTLMDDSGERHEVKDYYGCAESMDVL